MADWLNRLGAPCRRLLERVGEMPERERRTLQIGGPIILLLALYLLVGRPLVGHYLDVAERHQALRSDLAWMLEQRSHLASVNSFCPFSEDALEADRLKSLITAEARRLGLSAEVRQMSEAGRLNLRLAAAPGNTVLELLRDLGCRGLAITSLDIQRQDEEPALVDAELEVRLP